MIQRESTGATTEGSNGNRGGEQAAHAAADGSGARTRDETMQRAEEMVDHLTERLGEYAWRAGQQALRLAARAREEAEDFWAEVEAVRQRKS